MQAARPATQAATGLRKAPSGSPAGAVWVLTRGGGDAGLNMPVEWETVGEGGGSAGQHRRDAAWLNAGGVREGWRPVARVHGTLHADRAREGAGSVPHRGRGDGAVARGRDCSRDAGGG